jgi:ubiquinone biosynthesis protein
MPFRLGDIARTGHKMRRLAPIATVLARYGFGHVTRRFGLAGGRGKTAVSAEVETTPVRVRKMLEDLGPTFVKFGQMLATRSDIIPEAYALELRKLTEDVPPFDAAEAKRIIEEDLKRPIGQVFSEFSEHPEASGSIGQVHYGRLRTGEPVVVKVKRPDIESIILADVDLLRLAAPLADRIEELRALRLRMVVDEFHKSILREMDFVSEGSFTTKIREDFEGNPVVRIPKVYWEYTTSRVLVLERLMGISLNRKEELRARNVDCKRIARELTELFLYQYFKTGLFHADPHAGNILVLDDGTIGLVDFGMAARLGAELRGHLSTSFIALARRDLDMITEVYAEIGAIGPDTDLGLLKNDLAEVVDKYYGIPMHVLDPRRCFMDAMRIARVHQVRLPREFVLLGKSFVTMAMMARELDPEFDLAKVARPYALSLAADKLSPTKAAEGLLHEGWYLLQTMKRLPRDLRSSLRKLLGGTLQFALKIGDFDIFVRELDRATNRLAFSLIVSAIVIGSSVLLHAHVPPHMEKLPGWFGRFFADYMPQTSMLGLGGFLFAGMLGMLLAIAIWRSGKL